MSSLAERIRNIRGKMSREEFAQHIGVHVNTVGRYERGGSEPDISIASKICQEFGVNTYWFMFGESSQGSCNEFMMKLLFKFSDMNRDATKEISSVWPKVIALTKENGELKLEIERLKIKFEQVASSKSLK